MHDVIGIGSALFDTLMQADGFPKEDTKLQGSATHLQGGGPCATALVAMSRLGAAAAYLGTVGDDLYGDFIRQDFQRYGVGTAHLKVVPGTISFHAFVLLNTRNATRTCVWSKGTVPLTDPGDVPLAFLRGAKVLHLDGHHLEAALFAAGAAREAGVKVSLDAGGVYPGIERLLPLVDYLIPSEEFSLKYTGAEDAQAAARALHAAYHPEVLLITQGSRGGLLYDGRAFARYPAFPVEAVDTNGAGDVFHGAFVAARLRGMAPLEAARFASAVSALKCTRLGARQGVPSWEEAMAFLKSREEG